MTIPLSAIIIAKNEEEDLPGCLLSLSGWVSETIVVIDDSTSDRTELIAQEHSCKILRRFFDSYSAQKQAALDAANEEWVISIDADERVSPLLQKEIAGFLEHKPSANGVEIRFLIEFMGRQLRFGGMGHEKHLRLFRRLKGRFVGGILHEGLEVSGRIAEPLRGFMHHKPYKDLSDYLQKLDRYTTLSAQKGRALGKRFYWWHHLILPWENFSRLILKMGILDGKPGLIWAGLSAFHHWLKYAKLDDVRPRNEIGEQEKPK
jgi:glycosyltransferase involved in cell wall biosynthesis